VNIDLRQELTREPTHHFRMALSQICFLFVRRTPLDRLLEGKEVPAKRVTADLDAILRYTFAKASIDEVRQDLEGLREYAIKCVEREKVAAIAERLVKQAIKAGMRHSQVQTIVSKAIDRNEGAFPVEGW
jgi:DNA-binding transcriptional regulator YhcF (GntR family)